MNGAKAAIRAGLARPEYKSLCSLTGRRRMAEPSGEPRQAPNLGELRFANVDLRVETQCEG
jgi:hypothetical protein